MAVDRVIVIAKRTAYSQFVEEDQDPRARDLIARSDPSVRRWRKAHDDHLRTLEVVEKSLEQLRVKAWVLHGPRIVFDPSEYGLVVTVGGDGTLLAASHHVDNVPVLGVNSSPSHSIGFFCAATRSTVRTSLAKALSGELSPVSLARMQVEMDGGVVSRRVLNEALFCHEIPAATSRYILRFGQRSEEQRSSGLWVSTAAGSTGAIRSAGGSVLPLRSRRLQLVVREPYLGESRPYALERLVIPEGKTALVHNKMQSACLFLDGPYKRVKVPLGARIRFSVSDQSLTVLGVTARRR